MKHDDIFSKVLEYILVSIYTMSVFILGIIVLMKLLSNLFFAGGECSCLSASGVHTGRV